MWVSLSQDIELNPIIHHHLCEKWKRVKYETDFKFTQSSKLFEDRKISIICLLDCSKAGQVVCSEYHMTQVLQEEMIVAGVGLDKRSWSCPQVLLFGCQLGGSAPPSCVTVSCHHSEQLRHSFPLIKVPTILILFESFIPQTSEVPPKSNSKCRVPWRKAERPFLLCLVWTGQGVEPTTSKYQTVCLSD